MKIYIVISRRILFAFCGAGVLLLPGLLRAVTWPADDARLVYEGRIAVGPAHEVRWGFPGVTLYLNTTSTNLSFSINASSDDVYFDLVVDNRDPVRVKLNKGANSLPALDNAAQGRHSVALIRRTESWQGVCEIVGIEAAGGDLLQGPVLPQKRLLFVGDSITCGAGVDPSDVPGRKGHERSNASHSYGKVLARQLGTQCHLVSYGGRGVIRDWQGIRNTNNAPQFYDLALPDDPDSRWDASVYVPDAVGICLGQNDFTQGVPDQNEFVNAYVELISKIRRDAPKAHIFVIPSPMQNDPDGQVPRRTVSIAYLKDIVNRCHSSRVHYVSVSHYNGGPDDSHPIAFEHVQIAGELETAFRSALTAP